MSFNEAGKASFEEMEVRRKQPQALLRFGVEFLDNALKGIFRDDLILLGAPSGMGKTQLCCNIALANLDLGKRVHYIALEAGKFEIERRIKFPLIMERFLSDPDRPNLGKHLSYSDWLSGEHIDALKAYEDDVAEFFSKAYGDLFLFYKQEKFGINELLEQVALCSDKTDLILVDHVHYFDFDDDNEHRAIREIAKTVRQLSIDEQKPIILVAHLRKRDKSNEDLCAGLEEFHGSSDLYKIATRVITMSPGKPTMDGCYETFFRIPKNRIDGGVTRFLAREIFNPRKGTYEHGRYHLGWAESKKGSGFQELDPGLYPDWARRVPITDIGSHVRAAGVKNYAPKVGKRIV